MGDLPPKIEDLSEYEYDDEDEIEIYDAPTVVIDTSMDEKDVL